MSNAKPTPGPWISEEGGSRGAWIKGVTGEWSALACGDSDETARANARLIAAAPDLLAAAKDIAKWVEQRPTTHPYDAWRALNAAIAKAEGSQ